MTKAVQVLKKINHPRAEEFETFAKEQKELFVNAFRDASTKSKTWKDKTGTEYPMPPTSLSKTPLLIMHIMMRFIWILAFSFGLGWTA